MFKKLVTEIANANTKSELDEILILKVNKAFDSGKISPNEFLTLEKLVDKLYRLMKVD